MQVASLTVVAPTHGLHQRAERRRPRSTASSTASSPACARPFREAGIPRRIRCRARRACRRPALRRQPRAPARGQRRASGRARRSTWPRARSITGLVGPLDFALPHLHDPARPRPAPCAAVAATPCGRSGGDGPEVHRRVVQPPALLRHRERPRHRRAGAHARPRSRTRLAKASLAIRDFLRLPDVLGVVEVENLTTLQTLAARINTDASRPRQPDPGYVAFLDEGNDVGGIDVGFLVKSARRGRPARRRRRRRAGGQGRDVHQPATAPPSR